MSSGNARVFRVNHETSERLCRFRKISITIPIVVRNNSSSSARTRGMIIAASSPQAKGRVERVHGTHQDRLVKKLRRKQIGSHEVANVYLRTEYLPEHNSDLGERRRGGKIITVARRAPPFSTGFFDWRASARSARTGWSGTRIGIFSWSGRAVVTRRPEVKCWCAKADTAGSP
jgi:hypothetical protein